MSDEFDEIAGTVRRHRSSPNATSTNGRTVVSAARLVSRLYRSADQSLRARLLTCLVKPLSTLGLVAVAAGAFAGLLRRGSAEGSPVAIDDVAQYSSQQIFELASFVEQVSPEALQQLGTMLADNPVGITAFGASAAVLLLNALRSRALTSSSRVRRTR
jgi:hypothetical protein